MQTSYFLLPIWLLLCHVFSGWLLTRDVALELVPKWPAAHWDDWMRKPEVRLGRQCVFPEVPRSHTFGAVGTSKGLWYELHLAHMVLNKEPVDWKRVVSSF